MARCDNSKTRIKIKIKSLAGGSGGSARGIALKVCNRSERESEKESVCMCRETRLLSFSASENRTDCLQNLLAPYSSETHVFRSLSFIRNLNLALNPVQVRSSGLAESVTFLFGAVLYYMYENPQPIAFCNALSPWTAKPYPGHTTIFMAVTFHTGQ